MSGATIFEIIKASAKKHEIAFGSLEEALKMRYNYTVLPILNITKTEAIKINMHDRSTINKVFFGNLDFFTRYARKAVYNCYGVKSLCAEDIINQIYVDIRYYDFATEKTLRRCLSITCKTSNSGGITSYSSWRNERKADCFLYDLLSSHTSKMEEGETLLDFIKADDKSDPEVLLISKAEEEASRPYTELMIKQVTERLPPSQRKKFLEAFGG